MTELQTTLWTTDLTEFLSDIPLSDQVVALSTEYKLRNRALHVVHEALRVEQLTTMLQSPNPKPEDVGRLMYSSFDSCV
jgi:galactokinase